MSEEQLVYKKKKKKFKIFPIVNAIFFILVSLLILFPMWKVIVDSFDAHSAQKKSQRLRSRTKECDKHGFVSIG